MGNEPTLAISKLGCLNCCLTRAGGKNYDHWLAVSRGKSFPGPVGLHCLYRFRRISCYTESIGAVPSAAHHINSIQKTVESITSIFVQVRDVKCRGAATINVLLSELIDLGSEMEEESMGTSENPLPDTDCKLSPGRTIPAAWKACQATGRVKVGTLGMKEAESI